MYPEHRSLSTVTIRDAGGVSRTYDRTAVVLGHRYVVELPFSEVCMHLGCAGQLGLIELIPGAHPMVQLLRLDGTPRSWPILPGEAGVYRDDATGGVYCYALREAAAPPAAPLESQAGLLPDDEGWTAQDARERAESRAGIADDDAEAAG